MADSIPFVILANRRCGTNGVRLDIPSPSSKYSEAHCGKEHYMARLRRYFVPEKPLHVIQRGRNRQVVIFADENYSQCRDRLAEGDKGRA
jgi:hypothetical protein